MVVGGGIRVVTNRTVKGLLFHDMSSDVRVDVAGAGDRGFACQASRRSQWCSSGNAECPAFRAGSQMQKSRRPAFDFCLASILEECLFETVVVLLGVPFAAEHPCGGERSSQPDVVDGDSGMPSRDCCNDQRSCFRSYTL